MCCRYFADDDFEEKLEEAARSLGAAVASDSPVASAVSESFRIPFPARDIRPSEPAPVLVQSSLREMRWGFCGVTSQLLINARAESVSEKRAFADSFRARRAVIPASGFYEWDRDRNRNTFYLPDRGLMFMAGIFRREEDGDHFTIITTNANGSMKPVHDRMPLILNGNGIGDWLNDAAEAEKMLGLTPPELVRKPSYEQLSLFEM